MPSHVPAAAAVLSACCIVTSLPKACRNKQGKTLKNRVFSREEGQLHLFASISVVICKKEKNQHRYMASMKCTGSFMGFCLW